MAFVRTKNIGGKPYAYLVENHWQSGRARQRVMQYLGRVHDITKAHNSDFPDVTKHDFNTAVDVLITSELASHGFEKHKSKFVKDAILVDMNTLSVRNKNKPAVLRLNDGFLCTHTLKQLRKFEAHESEQQTGYALARRLVEAGLSVPKDMFVTIFDKVQKKQEAGADAE